MMPTCLIWGSIVSRSTLNRAEEYGGKSAMWCINGTDWRHDHWYVWVLPWPEIPQSPVCIQLSWSPYFRSQPPVNVLGLRPGETHCPFELTLKLPRNSVTPCTQHYTKHNDLHSTSSLCMSYLLLLSHHFKATRCPCWSWSFSENKVEMVVKLYMMEITILNALVT